MKKTIIVIFFLIPLLCLAQNFKIIENIQYGDFSRNKLDIYYPQEIKNRIPVVIWFHGGGLTGGDKFLPDQLKTDEYVIVAPQYRLMPDDSLQDCIDDAAKAVAWVIDSIGNFGGDNSKIFVSGHSAGGYLTSMIGLDKKWLQKYGKNADSLAGLIPFSGQVITHFAQRQKQGISELTPLIDEYAPLSHIRRDAPPYVIITGDRELELFGRYEENAYMSRMLKLNGHPYVYIYELDGYNHGDMFIPAFHIAKNHIKDILKIREENKTNLNQL